MGSSLWIPQGDIKSETTRRIIVGFLPVGRLDRHTSATLWQVGEVKSLYQPSLRPYVISIIQSQLNRSVPTLGTNSVPAAPPLYVNKLFIIIVQSDHGAV